MELLKVIEQDIDLYNDIVSLSIDTYTDYFIITIHTKNGYLSFGYIEHSGYTRFNNNGKSRTIYEEDTDYPFYNTHKYLLNYYHQPKINKDKDDYTFVYSGYIKNALVTVKLY